MAVPPVLQRQLAEAALNAWHARQQLVYDGWVLRFAQGYTKRANSVHILHTSLLPLPEKIATCEWAYAHQGLPTVFHLTPDAPPDLDRLLEQRSYRIADRSLVLYRDIHSPPALTASPAQIQWGSLGTWFEHLCRLTQSTPAMRRSHRALLGTIPLPCVFASLHTDQGVVACGMGVQERQFFGLFDLIVAPQQRQRGYGTHLLAHMLHWAHQQGAAHAYLQVHQENSAARRLYARMGFVKAYPYWYRLQPVRASFDPLL